MTDLATLYEILDGPMTDKLPPQWAIDKADIALSDQEFCLSGYTRKIATAKIARLLAEERDQRKSMTWTTDKPTEPGWYWVSGEEFLLVCRIYQRFSDKVLMVGNFDFEDGPLSGLSFGIEFQPVKSPDEK